ncbi:MAG: hypothetical protein AAFV88_02925 [Planctomycetota bacterium]
MAELQRLRQVIAQTQAKHQRELTSLRQSEMQKSAAFRKRAEAIIAGLEKELSDKASAADEKLQSVSQEKQRLEAELKAIKQELQNVAVTAASEQHTLKEQLARETASRTREIEQLESKHSSLTAEHAMLASKHSAIEFELAALVSRCEDQQQMITSWHRSSESALQLCEWLECVAIEAREEADGVAFQYEALLHEATALQMASDAEIARLGDSVSLLESDHLDSELVIESLDLRLDESQRELTELQTQIIELEQQAEERRAQTIVSMDELHEQLRQGERLLAIAATEKSSLVESVTRLQASADEFDASLFAKDQEVEATERLYQEAQSQLDRLRRENAAYEKQVAALQDTNHGNLDELRLAETQRDEAISRGDRLDQELSELRERENELQTQMRQMETAAKASQANTLLEFSEAEQQFQERLQTVETQLEEQQHESESQRIHAADRERQQSEQLETKTRQLAQVIEEREGQTADVIQLRDALQYSQERLAEVDLSVATQAQLTVERNEAQAKVNAQDEIIEQLQTRVRVLEENVVSAKSDFAAAQQQIEQWKETAEKAQAQSNAGGPTQDDGDATEPPGAEPDPRLEETLRREISVDLEGLWTRKIGEIQQEMLMQRERHHQALLESEMRLTKQSDQLASAQADSAHLVEHLREVEETLDLVQAELAQTRIDQHAAQEVNRLSRELGDYHAQWARERERLYGRISELQEIRQRRAA